MFCPNCGKKSSAEQKFCRSCGLALEEIVEILAANLPARTIEKTERRRETFELIGFIGLLMLAAPLVGVLFYKTVYKWLFLGENILSGVIAAFIIVGGLLALIFYSYADHLVKQERRFDLEDNLKLDLPAAADKLLTAGFFKPASVTEKTTNLLYAEKSKTTDELG